VDVSLDGGTMVNVLVVVGRDQSPAALQTFLQRFWFPVWVLTHPIKSDRNGLVGLVGWHQYCTNKACLPKASVPERVLTQQQRLFAPMNSTPLEQLQRTMNNARLANALSG
jgi:hypothetical protein